MKRKTYFPFAFLSFFRNFAGERKNEPDTDKPIN